MLDLLRRPAGSAADLVTVVLSLIESREHRNRARGQRGRAKLGAAVAVILGGTLAARLKRDASVYRPMSANSFSDSPVGYRTAAAAFAGLTSLGLLETRPGIRFQRDVAGFGEITGGRATRFRATDSLLALAARHGIDAVNVSRAFPREYPQRTAHTPLLLKVVALALGQAADGREAARCSCRFQRQSMPRR